MPMIRRSNRHHGDGHKVNKPMPDYLGDQIDEFMMSKRDIHQFLDNQIFEYKVDKNMLDEPIDVHITELKPDITELKPDITSSCLRNGEFGPGAMGIYPEIITIQFGEDIATKVMSFSGNGWAACVMSANGAVSRVTMRQGAYSQEIVTYEGYFEIISLSGSYQPSETGGRCIHRGGLGVLLAGLDGRVFCGGVAGPLTAASPVQVVIGRFPVDDKRKLERVVTSGTPGASSSTLNGSSGMQA